MIGPIIVVAVIVLVLPALYMMSGAALTAVLSYFLTEQSSQEQPSPER